MKRIKITTLVVVTISVITSAYAQLTCGDRTWNNGPNLGWTDSVSVDGKCYCASTNFDHGIADVEPAGYGGLTVVEICEILGDAPSSNNVIYYNDVQCGNGPANDAADEAADCCPGRVDIGVSGCLTQGPTWDSSVILGTSAPIGQTIAIIANGNGKYVSADALLSPARPLAANRNGAGNWELFEVVDAGGGLVGLISKANNKFVCADRLLDSTNWRLAANRNGLGNWEKFEWVSNTDGTFSLIAQGNNDYVCADLLLDSTNWRLAANRSGVGNWEKFIVE